MRRLDLRRKGFAVLAGIGLGTGLGSALDANGVMIPMELGRLAYGRSTYDDYLGLRGMKRLGKKKWKRHVVNIVQRFTAAVNPDDVVLGGGQVKELGRLPKGCRAGDNAHAFTGGFRLWEDAQGKKQNGGKRGNGN